MNVGKLQRRSGLIQDAAKQRRLHVTDGALHLTMRAHRTGQVAKVCKLQLQVDRTSLQHDLARLVLCGQQEAILALPSGARCNRTTHRTARVQGTDLTYRAH